MQILFFPYMVLFIVLVQVRFRVHGKIVKHSLVWKLPHIHTDSSSRHAHAVQKNYISNVCQYQYLTSSLGDKKRASPLLYLLMVACRIGLAWAVPGLTLLSDLLGCHMIS